MSFQYQMYDLLIDVTENKFLQLSDRPQFQDTTIFCSFNHLDPIPSHEISSGINSLGHF